MEKNEKDALDTYRQERKERIAKQAKKASKKSAVNGKTDGRFDKIIGAVIAVVVVVALLAASLSFLGIPHRAIKAITIDGKSYSAAELGYYYMVQYNNMRNTAYAYESQLGEGTGVKMTGYDSNKSPSQQITKDHDGNEVTWEEYFLEEAIEQMAYVKRYAKLAKEAGVALTDDDQKEIDSGVDAIRSAFATSAGEDNAKNYSTSSILSQFFYGKGVTESLYRKILAEQQLVKVYQSTRQDELKKGHTEEEIIKVYNEDKTAYDAVTCRWYTISVTSSTSTSEPTSAENTSANAKESVSGEDSSKPAKTPLAEELKAKQFIKAVKEQQNYNEETFKKTVLEYENNKETYQDNRATLLQKVSKEAIKTNVSEDAANWLYAVNDNGDYIRQAGDMEAFLSSDSKTVYIFYAIGTPFQDNTLPASVRHILVKFPEETASEPASGESTSSAADAAVSATTKAECESKAQSILDEYNNYIKENEDGAADEEYFGELAKKYTDDAGSKESGGLIENMANNSSYVESFETWAFADGRKVGDTDIIESEYGYHVMYYVGHDENPAWKESILSTLIKEEWEAEDDKFTKSFAEDAIAKKESVIKWVKKNCAQITG